jgi:hypothetical protein
VRKKREYEVRGAGIYQNTDEWVNNGTRMLAKVSTEMYMVESGEPCTHTLCAKDINKLARSSFRQSHLGAAWRLASSVVLSASSVDQSIPRVASR